MSNIWFGLIEVKAVNGNSDLQGASGAFVNVAYKAIDENDFVKKVHETFNEYDFEIAVIEDVENETTLDTTINTERLQLLNSIREGSEMAWGVFNTWY